MTIYVEYFESIFNQEKNEQRALKDIINIISTEQLLPSITAIRETNDKDIQDKKKQALWNFRPAVISKISNEPNGIVHLDIDTKDNIGVNFVELKNMIKTLPQCVFVYESPRMGLKIGILTDLKKDFKESDESISERYKQAYDLVVKHLSTQLTINFKFDDGVRKLSANCNLSCDADAYFNQSAQALKVNELCQYHDVIYNNEYITSDISEVLDLLAKIPRNLGYNDRLPINFSVLNMLGKQGINILLSHWDKTDKKKLKSDIKSILNKNNKFGDIRLLQSKVNQYNPTPTTGKARKKLKPALISNPFLQLKTIQEGKEQMQNVISEFFNKKQSTFLAVTTGAGKTEYVMDYLVNELSNEKNVLLLVPTHDLAEEICNGINTRDYVPVKHNQFNSTKAIHLFGREKLCKSELLESFTELNISIPTQHCSRECTLRENCQYLKQFNEKRTSNIIIMTHNEWFNKDSAWSNGYTESETIYTPASDVSWKPDYIIIDENIISFTDKFKDNGKNFDSIKHIIGSCMQGIDLIDAIEIHKKT